MIRYPMMNKFIEGCIFPRLVDCLAVFKPQLPACIKADLVCCKGIDQNHLMRIRRDKL